MEEYEWVLIKGGPGSGNFGHSGRPGKVGGSGPSGGTGGTSGDSSSGTAHTCETQECADEWGKQEFSEWRERLNWGEEAFIRKYSSSVGSDYQLVNNYLRNGHLADNEELRQRTLAGVEWLDRAMNKTDGISSPVIVHRGLCDSAKCTNAYKKLKVGSEFEDKGYVSTSVREIDDFKGKISLQILVPAGSRGFYMGDLSTYTPDEAEFLLPRGSKFKVLEIQDEGGVRNMRVVLL